jgi:Flp pilus assembly protein TadG
MITRALSPNQRRRSRQEGAAAVEFALVAPLLIILVFGIISFGILFAQQLSLGNAARQGARFGVVEGRTCADIAAEAKAASQTIGLNPASVTVEIRLGMTEATTTNPCTDNTKQPCDNSTAGQSVYVKTKFTGELIVPLVLFDPTFPLSGKGVFRCEFS